MSLFGTITPAYAERLRALDYQAIATFLEYWSYQLPHIDDVFNYFYAVRP